MSRKNSSTKAMPSSQAIPRLILIDGANFMHVYKSSTTGNSNTDNEGRQNAFHLISYVYYFQTLGYDIRIVASKAVETPLRTQSVYVIQELSSMGLVFHPPESDKESDDRYLLQLATKYGAIILSNDKYRNHPEYAGITRQIVSYKRKKCKLNEAELGQDRFPVDCLYKLYGSQRKFYAEPSDLDYENVQRVRVDIPYPSKDKLKKVELLMLYQHCDLCAKYGVKLPKSVTFIDPKQPFPTSFTHFQILASKWPSSWYDKMLNYNEMVV